MNQQSFFYAIEPFVRRLPSVERPTGHVHFKRKLSWTLAILILYFVLGNIPLFGLSKASIDLFSSYRAFFAGSFGSMMLLGIGPIVTASIVLQLLVGADIIKLNLSDPRDQAIYQGTQKALVFVMVAVEALPQVLGGYLLPDANVASALGVSLGIISLLIFIQVFIGGSLIVYMDEVVSKWGVGSGVGLFIVAGISQQLVTGLINPATGDAGLSVGIIPKWIDIIRLQLISFDTLFTSEGLRFIFVTGGILALISTIVIILLVVLVESTRIEIPLAHSRVRGARGRFPVKLVYASVLPMILVRAIQANIEMLGALMASRLGTVTSATVTGEGSDHRLHWLLQFPGQFHLPGTVRFSHWSRHQRIISSAGIWAHVLPLANRGAERLDSQHGDHLYRGNGGTGVLAHCRLSDTASCPHRFCLPDHRWHPVRHILD